MPWKEETIMSLKEEFIKRALARETSFAALCRDYNITRKTGYLWVKRYQEEGSGGLAPRSKRPLSSPFKTDEQTEEVIVTTRLQHPTWGARKIIRYLQNKGINALPSPSTITDIFKRHHLISIEESLKRQQFIRFEREHPNALWQMDFKGHFQLLTKQACYPLTLIDDHSRFSLDIKASKNEQYITVKTRLTYLFKKYGLPDQINVDNGSPWGNSKLLPYTALTVWLMQLGIKVTHSRPRHPQTNGKCERFHRTLKNDLILRCPMRSFTHAQKQFDQWRWLYNHERPHEALDMDVPAQHYQASHKIMPASLPTLDYHDDAILRKVRGNGYICYKNTEYLVGEAFKEQQIEIKHNDINRSIELYFGQFRIYTYDV